MARAIKQESPLTIEELTAYYREINQTYLGGELPNDMKITFTGKRDTGGICHARVNQPNAKRRWGKWVDAFTIPGSVWIEISLTQKRSAENMKAILLHEMIHAVMYLRNEFEDGQQHGPIFERMRKSWSAMMGVEIPTVDNFGGERAATDTPIAVIVQHFRGKFGYALLTIKAAEAAMPEILRRWASSNVEVFSISDPDWKLRVLKQPVSRKLNIGHQFYQPRTDAEQWYADLKKHGTLMGRAD